MHCSRFERCLQHNLHAGLMSLASSDASFVVAVSFAAVLFSSLGWHASSSFSQLRSHAKAGRLSEQYSKHMLRELFHELSDGCCSPRAKSADTTSTTTTTPSPEILPYDFWWWFKFAMLLGGVLSGLCFGCIGFIVFRIVAGLGFGEPGSPAEAKTAIAHTAAEPAQQLQVRDQQDISSIARAQAQAARARSHGASPQ